MEPLTKSGVAVPSGLAKSSTSTTNGGAWAAYGPIRAMNVYVVDAQGFTINGEFHPRELWVTNPVMSWGIELDLDVSHKTLQRIPIADFNTCARQTDRIHGLHFRSRRHSMNRLLVGSRRAGFILSKLYEVFHQCAPSGELPVFCVKNHELFRLMKREETIKRIVNLDEPAFEFPSLDTLETYYAEWKTQCFCHQMPNRTLYRCSQAKNNIILTHLMKNNYLNIIDRDFGTALGNMTTAILDSRFVEALITVALDTQSLAQPGGVTPMTATTTAKPTGANPGEPGVNLPTVSTNTKPTTSTNYPMADEMLRKQDASWETVIDVNRQGGASIHPTIVEEGEEDEGFQDGPVDESSGRLTSKGRCRRSAYWPDDEDFDAPPAGPRYGRGRMNVGRFGY